MAKCKNTILNELMDNAAELIKGKIQFNEIVLEQFQEKNDQTRVKSIQEDIDKMKSAMNTINEYSGCWA